MSLPAGIERPDLQTFFITFGVQYPREPHPKVVWAHANGWLEVLAPDENTARAMAFEVLGNAWSFIYTTFDFSVRYFPLGALARLYPSADPMAVEEAHEDGSCVAILSGERPMVLHVLTSAPWLPLASVSDLEG